MKFKVATRIKTKILDRKWCEESKQFVPGEVVKESPWIKNLVFDQGLNQLARRVVGGGATSPANATLWCHIGSGTNPNRISSGAITFTQVGTTLTASGNFFTSNMAGGIFKWGSGSGGAENYIASFTSATEVELVDSDTVAVPEVGVVWQVQQTALQTEINRIATYQTNSGDCGTTTVGGLVTHKRTYLFPSGSSYTVNEIGYGPANSAPCVGRVVLSSSDVVSPTNFYVVVIELEINYTPDTPTAVADVGININTAGDAMIEWLAVQYVNSTGTTNTQANRAALDGSNPSTLIFLTANWTQIDPPTVPSGTPSSPPSNVQLSGTAGWSNDATTLGRMTNTHNGTVSTSGQTLYGLMLIAGGQRIFSVHFTTPQTAPTGTFQPVSTFEVVYSRTLVN